MIIKICPVCNCTIKVPGIPVGEDCGDVFLCSDICREMFGAIKVRRLSVSQTDVGYSPYFIVEEELPGPLLRYYEP